MCITFDSLMQFIQIKYPLITKHIRAVHLIAFYKFVLFFRFMGACFV